MEKEEGQRQSLGTITAPQGVPTHSIRPDFGFMRSTCVTSLYVRTPVCFMVPCHSLQVGQQVSVLGYPGACIKKDVDMSAFVALYHAVQLVHVAFMYVSGVVAC